MRGRAGAGSRAWPFELPDLSILAFIAPALAGAVLDGGWILPAVTGLGALAVAGILALGRPRWREWALPLALLTILLPAAAAPAGLLGPILAAGSSIGLLLWVGRSARVASSAGAFARAILFPVGTTVFAAAVALTVPGLSGSPGDAALFAVAALLVIAFLFVRPEASGPDALPEGFVPAPPRHPLTRRGRPPAGDLRDARTTTKGPS